MSESAATHDHSEGHDPVAIKTYVAIGGVLLVGTVLAFIFAEQLTLGWLPTVLLLFGIASFKVSLVMLFFMHLKFEGRWKYVLTIPPFLLVLALIMALLPDIAGYGRYG